MNDAHVSIKHNEAVVDRFNPSGQAFRQATERMGWCYDLVACCFCCCRGLVDRQRWRHRQRNNGTYVNVAGGGRGAGVGGGDGGGRRLVAGVEPADDADDADRLACCEWTAETRVENIMDLERAGSDIEVARVKVADADVKIVRANNYVKASRGRGDVIVVCVWCESEAWWRHRCVCVCDVRVGRRHGDVIVVRDVLLMSYTRYWIRLVLVLYSNNQVAAHRLTRLYICILCWLPRSTWNYLSLSLFAILKRKILRRS